MKGKILELLKTKFVGVDEKILGRISEKLAEKTTSEEEATKAVEGVTFQSIIEAESDRRATEAQKTAVSNYEKKHKIKDGKPVDEPTPPAPPTPPKGDEMPDWAKALMEKQDKQIEALTSRLEGIDKEKTANARKSTFAKAIANLPQKTKEVFEKDFARMSFTDDEDFESWMTDKKTDIEEIEKESKAKGSVNRPPMGGGSPTGEISDALKARAEAVKKEAEKLQDPFAK